MSLNEKKNLKLICKNPEDLKVSTSISRKEIIESIIWILKSATFTMLFSIWLSYRDIIISYERLINIIYEHMMEVYEPARLRLILDCNPRGGIMSRTTIDSDWKALGGEEKYKGWGEDVW